MARSTLKERITRPERSGMIAGYTVRLGPAAAGRRVTAHVAITIDPERGDHVQQTLRHIAGVRTLHTGERAVRPDRGRDRQDHGGE